MERLLQVCRISGLLTCTEHGSGLYVVNTRVLLAAGALVSFHIIRHPGCPRGGVRHLRFH